MSIVQPNANKAQRIITPAIWLLSIISLFTDMASEMLFPVMPIFLKEIGFSILLIGLLEGIAEAVAGLSKSYFGKLSDQSAKRLPFVQWGYAISAISKPMMAIFIFPAWIFLARTLDRIGKGIRTGARDALLSDEATQVTKGRVFGFHRSMDTFGAVLGPCFALLFLYFYPKQYSTLFYIAFIPGLMAIAATFILKEKNSLLPSEKKPAGLNFFVFTAYWRSSPTAYKKLLIGLLAFALFNSSDVFLLLKMKSAGLNDTAIIGVYVFYNLIYALLAYPIGILADKIGLKKIFMLGLLMFAIVYAGFSGNQPVYIYVLLFSFYAVYAAATEGISKAWITNTVSNNETATAIGTFSGFQSIAALIASNVTGLIWFCFGATFTFLLTASITLLVILYFYLNKIPEIEKRPA